MMLKSFRRILWMTLFGVTCLTGCKKQDTLTVLEGHTMGTYYRVTYQTQATLEQDEIQKQIESLLARINEQMSTYLDTSQISAVNKAHAQQKIAISEWFYEVLKYSLDLAQLTEGAFDPTIGPLVNLWGFGPSKIQHSPDETRRQQVMQHVGYQKVQLHFDSTLKQWTVQKQTSQVYLDLSAIAKGFAVDKVSELLTSHGLNNHLVDIGGELRAQGKKSQEAWRIGIEKPDPAQRSIQVSIPLLNLSIATSGNYRNFYKENGKTYAHTLDPRTGSPVQHSLLSATVLDTNCMQADAKATALMALGPEKAMTLATANKWATFLIVYDTKTKQMVTRMTPEFTRLSGIK